MSPQGPWLGAAPCSPPIEWGQCPPGAKWKASGSPPMSTCPEHRRNSGGAWAILPPPLSPGPISSHTQPPVIPAINFKEPTTLFSSPWVPKYTYTFTHAHTHVSTPHPHFKNNSYYLKTISALCVEIFKIASGAIFTVKFHPCCGILTCE